VMTGAVRGSREGGNYYGYLIRPGLCNGSCR
jgi:hypothetical protein